MKRQIARLLLLAFFMFLPACALPLPGTLWICIDGAAYRDVSGLLAEFREKYPQIQVEVEVLPEVELTVDEQFLPVLDADSAAARAAALEQNRAALLAGDSGFDLYLVTGSTSQLSPINGGALVEDPYALMASGAVEDLSALGRRLDSSALLEGVLEAGQWNGRQYLIPLRVELPALMVDSAAGVAFPTQREAFFQLLCGEYGAELAAANIGCGFSLASLSRPVVNKAQQTIALREADYAAALALSRAMYAQRAQGQQTAEEGRTILAAAANPLLWAASSAARMGIPAGAVCQLVPNEAGGATADIVAYGFVPKGGNAAAASVLLEWLLSEPVQDGRVPVYNSMGGGYPVRKGCAQGVLAHTREYAGAQEKLGQTFLDSLAGAENQITCAKYVTHCDFELVYTLNGWQNGAVQDLDGALDQLYAQWTQYLGE